jgi:HAD superfamily hydrolase (TIGR01509 family)
MPCSGAQDIASIVMKPSNNRERFLCRALNSRFEETWNAGSSLRAVIFGVLVDSMRDHLKGWRTALREAGVRFDEDDLMKEVYLLEGQKPEETARELFAKYQKSEPNQATVNRIVERKVALLLQCVGRLPMMPGVKDTLSFLKSRNVRLAVVTGSTRETARAVLQRLFASVFNVVITGSDVANGKPDPESYEAAIDGLGIGNRAQCLVVENAPLGVRSAAAAGIPVCGVLIESPLQAGELQANGARRVFLDHESLLEALRMLRFG